MFDCNCKHLTHVGIASAIREKPNLKSFTISFDDNERMYVSSKMVNSIRSLKSLTYLNLSFVLISDRSLSSLAEEGLPLKRLVLKRCMNHTYAGIFCLLSKCRILQHLDLQSAQFLIDQQVAELSLFLGNLVSINLTGSNMLTDLALFALVKNCRLLADIRMEKTGIGKFCFSLMDFLVYPQVESLHLANNSWLSDESIKKFASIFPNLQVLDTSDCDLSEGIVEVLRCCNKIMHLRLTYCPKLELLRMNFQVPKLEVLNLSMSEIDDQTLYMISKSFSGLRQLDLKRCDRITEKGVKQVVENCTRLREINIRYCRNVAADVDFWLGMVFTRPSLRKIIAPSHFDPSHSKWIPLLDHGCFVC
jgi:F-box/leucine-rich repeat protein 2/20